MTRPLIATFLLIASLVSLAPAQVVSLDGTWSCCRSDSGDMPGPEAKWAPVKVPSFLGQAGGQPLVWYRRSLAVPGEFAGRHVFLRFGGVKFVSEVYLNGKRLGGHYGGWEPFEIEITGACRIGQPNELLVRVQDCTGVIDQEMDYAKRGRGVRFLSQAKDAVMAPVGSQYSNMGIWEPVSLIARGDVYVEDVFVRTSVRGKKIEADVTLRNLGDAPRKVTLTGALAEGSEAAPEGGLGWKAGLSVPAGGALTHTFTRAWPDPRLWCPGDPYLYHLVTKVTEQGKELEARATRFGFRELWTDGPNLVLNGVPMHFLATAGHPRGQPGEELSKPSAVDFYRRIREAGCVAMRLHANVWPKCWYEAADEVGMPLIMESALFCYSQQYALSKPQFWKNYHDHLRAIVRDHRNHPSIVMISLENEILHCGGERVPETVHRLAEAGRLVKRLDPTRPIMFDADGDPEGVADVVNLHYPLDFDRQNLWPNCAWWLETGMEVHGWPHKLFRWDRKKPLYFGEFLHLQHYRQPDNYTTLLGQCAYAGFDQAMACCKASAWGMQIEAYRASDVSGMCPWTLTETGPFPRDDNPRYRAVLDGYRKNAVFVREHDLRFYAGQEVERTVYLYNDTPRPADLTLRWAFPSGSAWYPGSEKSAEIPRASGSREFHAAPAERLRHTIKLKMPQVDRRLHMSWHLSVTNGKEQAGQVHGRCAVFPRAPLAVRKGMHVALVSAKTGPLRDRLRESGAEVMLVDKLDKLPEAEVLLFAPHALPEIKIPKTSPVVGDDAGLRESIAAFVRRGGTVIVLEQDSYQGGLFPVDLVDRGCTIAFRRRADSSLLEHTANDDFCFWAGDHVVARKTIRKPTAGPWRTLVDSGGPEGLVYCPLVELREGLGRYLFCQLLVGEKLDTEPITRLMLQNMLDYATKKNPPPVKLAVVQDKLPLADAVDDVDARFTDLSGKLGQTDLSTFGVLLAEADAAEVARNRQKLRRFVEAGGKVILHAGTAPGLAALKDLFPEPIAAQRTSALPVNLRRPDPVISGLSNQELYWYASREGLSWRERTPLSTAVCDHVIVAGEPDPQQLKTIEAEAMTAARGEPRVSKTSVYMYAAGAVKTAVDFSAAGEYAFCVRARGTPVGGVYPEITVSIDRKRAGSVTAQGKDWGGYHLTADVPEAGRHEVTLAFTNDAHDPERGEDRNVELDWLSFGPMPPLKSLRLLQPAALVKVPLGKGFLLLDQIRWDRPEGNQEKAARYLSCLLNNLHCEFASPVGVLTIAGADMKPEKNLKLHASRDGAAYLGTNGTIFATVRFAKARRYELAVVVEGTEAAGQWPKIDVSIDGRKVGQLALKRPGRQILRLATDVPQGEHRVGLSFINDYYEPPADRNLRIRELRIR